MSRALFLISSAALALSACAPMQWVKADAGPAQLQADLGECQQEAWRESTSRFLRYHPVFPTVVQDSAGRRFLVYPYGPFADPYGSRFAEESRLTDFCMRAKGWRLEETPKP